MKQTSWEKVADWYDELLQNQDTYQEKVIWPNLKRLLDMKAGQKILDLACGQGFFSERLQKTGATIIGVDASGALIGRARKIAPKVKFVVSPADRLDFLKENSVDKIIIVLAIQNIENPSSVFKECARVLKPKGQMIIVMNHPAFRIPKQSSWGWDDKEKIQYRRLDGYLSESKVKIQMHPGKDAGAFTLSFHRPLQFYFKVLRKNNLAVKNIEEWESHKKSQPGPRAKAEDKARKEFPLFLCMEVVKISS